MTDESIHRDLVTWTLDNAEVGENSLIFQDAVDPDRRLCKSQVRKLVRQLIAGFRFENDGAYLDGDVVCLHAFNDILYPAISLAIVGAGGCWTGTNPAYTASELTHHFRTSKTRFILTEPEHLPQILVAASACNIPHACVFVFSPKRAHASRTSCRDWTDLLQHEESDWIRFDDARRSRETLVGLFSTSGTTGLPKMAARTHLSFVAESVAIRNSQSKPYKETRLLCVPFFHAFVAPLSLVAALRHGVMTYVMRRYEHATFVACIKKFGITETALVPPIIIKFLSCPIEEQQALRSLRLVWCAGAPLDAATQAKGERLFASDGRVAQVWGMTECGWITTFHYPEMDSSGSVGRLVSGYQAKLLRDDDTEATNRHEYGEICVKGPMMMQGYYGDAAATAASFTGDGWFRTGDIARLDGGLVYIVDRKKELIKVRGWQVAPAELESILLKHDAVIDAAVIGVAAADGISEIPRAYVIRKPSCTVSEQDIKLFLLIHLSRYKVSDCQVCFCESIPRSASGKILRKVLRAEAEREVFESQILKKEAEAVEEGTDHGHQSSTPVTSTIGSFSFIAVILRNFYRRVIRRICCFAFGRESLWEKQRTSVNARLRHAEQCE